jgi:hypothetical protein
MDVLVAAFTLPGDDAEAAYRMALEGRLDLRRDVDALARFGRILVQDLGWDRGHAEAAIAQVVRISGADSTAPDVLVTGEPAGDPTVEVVPPARLPAYRSS